MAVQIIIFAIFIAGLFYLKVPSALYTYYRQLKASKRLPHIPGHWLWGNAHQIAASFHDSLAMSLDLVQSKRCKVTTRWIGPFLMELEIVHPEPLKKILKEPKDDGVYRLFRPWLGDGLLLSSGKKWARNRRLLTPGFHYNILKSYIPVYSNCVSVLCDKWEKIAAKNETVKLFETISMLSLDIILQCAFSYHSYCQDSVDNEEYVKAVLTILEMIVDRYLNPLYQIDWYYWKTPTGRKLKQCCDLAHAHSENVIKERKKVLGLDKEVKNIEVALKNAEKDHKRLDFLDILLTAEDESGEGLTDLEIRDEVDTFMFEGHDTTTSGMCWTLYCLAKHPEAQEKVREEVRGVLQGRNSLDYDDLKELKYTQWAIKEAMRLQPPVTDIARVLSKDTEFEGVVVPKGTRVFIKFYQYHRHPDIWENPNEYNPLRFSPENLDGRDPYAYIPFSAGQRNCIGQNFALNEEKVVVASIVNRFKLSLKPGQKVVHHPIGIFKVKEDLELQLESK